MVRIHRYVRRDFTFPWGLRCQYGLKGETLYFVYTGMERSTNSFSPVPFTFHRYRYEYVSYTSDLLLLNSYFNPSGVGHVGVVTTIIYTLGKISREPSE